jgi:hypothetical protein
VTALDVERLDVDPASISPSLLHFNFLGHVVGRALLSATYGR